MQISNKAIRELQDRGTVLQANSEKIYSKAKEVYSPKFENDFDLKLEAIVMRNASLKSKIRHLQLVTSEFREPIKHLVPCQKGCSICCYIQVEISEVEAGIIGEASSRKPVVLPPGIQTTDMRFLGRPDTPCPFLFDNSCSIYEYRPVVCRHHTLLDVDNLLCSFENMALTTAGDSRAVSMPLLMSGPIQTAYRNLNLQRRQAFADIRQFFPV